MPRQSSVTEADDESRVSEFIAKFDPAHQALIRAVRRAMRRRFRGAVEMVYDNYNFFVIGYSPTERPSDAILSITANANGVGVCFTHGAKLADPSHVLRGSGNQTRSIHVPSIAVLKTEPVQALMNAAEAQARVPFPASRTKLVIRSVSAKQRPRRKTL
jgi:hypothetical protein